MRGWKCHFKHNTMARVRLVGLLWLVTLLPPLLPAQDHVSLPENPLAGRALFQRKQCFRCHAIAGRGTGIGRSLGEGRFRGTFLDMGAALWNHAPAMSVTFEVTGLPRPDLNAEEASELLVFLYFIDYLGRPGAAPAGQNVFRRGGCSSCHVIGGGAAKVGPDLAGLSRFASPLYVAQEIWNHGPSMFASMRARSIRPPSFEEGDLADLSAYIRQQAGSTPRRPLLSAPGNPNQGRELFRVKGCASCHGETGRGGGGGPDLTQFDLHRSAEALAALMWNHSLAMSGAMSSRGIDWPSFRDSELADLLAFLYFLPFRDPPGNEGRGERLFRERSCGGCHSGTGTPALGEAAADLTGGQAIDSPAALVAAMWKHAPIMQKAILGQGRRWPELSGSDLRDLMAYLARRPSEAR